MLWYGLMLYVLITLNSLGSRYVHSCSLLFVNQLLQLATATFCAELMIWKSDGKVFNKYQPSQKLM